MTQDLTGCYCPKCDTVWASPGVCNCDPLLAEHETALNVYEREVWNKAIEAAAELFPHGEWEEIDNAEKIRKLKR